MLKARRIFLPVRPCDELRNAVATLCSCLAVAERITVQRRVDNRGGSRVVDVGEYIQSIEIKDDGVLAQCR